ncbi:6-cysteine protein, putative [Plasmodium ovale]|uniref:6-cysteine protein, putative n=3 Tax=Plasmodium ovale TaxID=36330 RepID=A0A1A8WVR9_PLAOA|nr:6-cysteine protein, putative [Plasmodium ovale curtisi]SCA48341.1 6-cysteine protein, putative [Plasmodium ovale]
MGRSLLMISIVLFSGFMLLFEKYAYCLFEGGSSLCTSEFDEDRDCYVDTNFGKAVTIFCPTDLRNNNDDPMRINNMDINNINTCFNKMKKNEEGDVNPPQSLLTLIPDLIIHTDRKRSSHYFFVPHNVHETFSVSCFCIDRERQKVHKLNIQFKKYTNKDVKGCNFYYADEKAQENAKNALEKNVNLKYDKNCDIDGNANDIVYFKCSSRDSNNSNVIVSPLLCFHTVFNEKYEEVQIKGMVNGARVIPETFFYYKDKAKNHTLLSYLLLPTSIQETAKVRCTCTITNPAEANFYTGTLSLNLEKNDSLYPNVNIYGRGINEGNLSDGKEESEVKESSSLLDHVCSLLIIFLFFLNLTFVF